MFGLKKHKPQKRVVKSIAEAIEDIGQRIVLERAVKIIREIAAEQGEDGKGTLSTAKRVENLIDDL